MLILLPPSESKFSPASGKYLDLDALTLPELAPARARVLDALIDVSARADATKVLGVADTLIDLVADNTGLRQTPCAPAARTYTGVLYDALDLPSLDASAKRRAASRLLIFSALFGVLRTGDRIPAYRLSGGTKLPGIGSVSRFWRDQLTPQLDALASNQLIVDCRSAAYASMWDAPKTLSVKVFREVAGKRTVVSHMAKHFRGLVARALLTSSDNPRSPEQAAAVLRHYCATHPVTTAAGVPVRAQVELTAHSINVITD